MKRDRDNRVRLALERLEARDVPGTLSVTPPAHFIDPSIDLVKVPDAAQPGLQSAEVQTGGTISWFIDPSIDL